MLAAVDEIRGGFLLVISVLIGIFFFIECLRVIIHDGSSEKKTGAATEIKCRVSCQGKSYGREVFLNVTRNRGFIVGADPAGAYDLNLCDYHLPDSVMDLSMNGPWFEVSRDLTGVLTVTGDKTMDGLKVRRIGDKQFSPLRKVILEGKVIVALGDIEITLQSQD